MFKLCWWWRFLSSFIFKMDCEGVGFIVLVLCMEQGSFSPWWSTRNILFWWVSVCFTAEGSSPVHDHLRSKAGSQALLHCGNVCFLGPLCSGFAAGSGVLQAPRTSPPLWKDKRTKWGESLWFCAVRMTFRSGGKNKRMLALCRNSFVPWGLLLCFMLPVVVKGILQVFHTCTFPIYVREWITEVLLFSQKVNLKRKNIEICLKICYISYFHLEYVLDEVWELKGSGWRKHNNVKISNIIFMPW